MPPYRAAPYSGPVIEGTTAAGAAQEQGSGQGRPAVRAAATGDAAEVVRLRRLMFTAMSGRDSPGPWEAEAERMLAARLARPPAERSMGVFVVDAPGGGLAACAVGTVEERLPAPSAPSGRFGFVFNVCTDPGHRRRGYARAAMEALLEWFTAQGVHRVDLHATPDAAGLYRDLGFSGHALPLSLDLRGHAGS
jgi:GNAT superfamily N-acetyltransferase